MARKEDFNLKRLEYWLNEREKKFIEKHLLSEDQSLQNYVQSLLRQKIENRRKVTKELK